MDQINWAVITPLLVIQLILLIVALVDLIRIERTKGPKWAWALVILFIGLLGPVLYFSIGRRTD